MTKEGVVSGKLIERGARFNVDIRIVIVARSEIDLESEVRKGYEGSVWRYFTVPSEIWVHTSAPCSRAL